MSNKETLSNSNDQESLDSSSAPSASDCSSSVSLRTLRDKIDEYGHLPGCFADDCDSALQELEVLREKVARLEAFAGWALTVETRNTNAWMKGMRDAANRVLVADGDARRCVYERGRLILRNVTQCIPDSD